MKLDSGELQHFSSSTLLQDDIMTSHKASDVSSRVNNGNERSIDDRDASQLEKEASSDCLCSSIQSVVVERNKWVTTACSPLLVRYRSRERALKRRSGDMTHSRDFPPSDFTAALLERLTQAQQTNQSATQQVLLALSTCFLSSLLATFHLVSSATHNQVTSWIASCALVTTGAALLLTAGVYVVSKLTIFVASFVTSALMFTCLLLCLVLILFNVACFTKYSHEPR